MNGASHFVYLKLMAYPPVRQLHLRLHDAAKAKGMNVSDVARLMPEVARSTVGHWFTGERKPQLDHLLKLAKVLEVSAAALVADEPDYASTADEKLALKLIRDVSPETRQAVLALLKASAGEN